MHPSENGWLKEYLENRKSTFLNFSDEFPRGQNPDQSFYGLIQPRGLMYGYPVNIPENLDQTDWSRTDKVKVLLADSLINIAELYNNSQPTEAEYWTLMTQITESVTQFYNAVYPEIATSSKTWMGKKIDIFTLAEKILEKRASITLKKLGSDFWTEFFYQTQLFFDVYIFSQWTHTKPDQVLIEFFREEKTELSYTSVKVMAAAAHSNKLVEGEEQRLFQHFIANAGFPAEKRRVAQEYFDHGLGIQEIPIEKTDPWIIRKFFLELAILTVWSDKRVDKLEVDFLNSFNISLGFSDNDLDHSMIAVEGFVLQNWDKLDSLQDKKNYEEVSHEFIWRVSRIAEKHKDRLIKSMKEDRMLIKILTATRSSAPDEEEKKIVKNKLILILKTIPSFKVIALPQDFLSYDILLKIIPADVIKEVMTN